VGEVLVLVSPAGLGRRGGVVDGYLSVPEHERLDPDDARALARKLDRAADRLEEWDAELIPVLRRQAEINDRFLGASE
jgi:hypothetical protein